MFLVNGLKATLIQYNRDDDSSIYDDQNRKSKPIKLCPYNVDDAIKFGIYTIPEATGYFQVPRKTDVAIGDQIVFRNKTYTVLKVQESWIFNRIENKILAVK